MLLPAPSYSPFAKHRSQNAFTIAVYQHPFTKAVSARDTVQNWTAEEVYQLNALVLPSFCTYRQKKMEHIDPKYQREVWDDCILRASASVQDWHIMHEKQKSEAKIQNDLVIQARLLQKQKWEAERQKFIMEALLHQKQKSQAEMQKFIVMETHLLNAPKLTCLYR